MNQALSEQRSAGLEEIMYVVERATWPGPESDPLGAVAGKKMQGMNPADAPRGPGCDSLPSRNSRQGCSRSTPSVQPGETLSRGSS